MKNYAMHLFRLGDRLANALGGDKQALADLQKLYYHHPEMFADLKDLISTIESVAQKPEIITEAKTSNALLAAKRLNSEKMGDIVVKNNNGMNEIIHANKKRMKEFDRLLSSLVETPTPSTHRQSLEQKSTGELIAQKDELSGANARSVNSQNNSTTIPNASQTKVRKCR
ncbi:hypothetical protein [Helicobacter sp. MIT 01-3238]|uniref:hypothetical protein n=1 Tax=Helicobacter sp. MIT 01-3238 TaxID=398627 RepID=UPI000E1F5D42|nr:hypothetical protein [Helicobacter sp. MIT 01-3238]RDU52910.1 hypothetical protein CQA40_06300 [Helicobacter sp. MIT 01-3238]